MLDMAMILEEGGFAAMPGPVSVFVGACGDCA